MWQRRELKKEMKVNHSDVEIKEVGMLVYPGLTIHGSNSRQVCIVFMLWSTPCRD